MSQSTFDAIANTIVVVVFGAFIIVIAYFVLEGQKDKVWCEAKGGVFVTIDGEHVCVTIDKTIKITR